MSRFKEWIDPVVPDRLLLTHSSSDDDSVSYNISYKNKEYNDLSPQTMAAWQKIEAILNDNSDAKHDLVIETNKENTGDTGNLAINDLIMADKLRSLQVTHLSSSETRALLTTIQNSRSNVKVKLTTSQRFFDADIENMLKDCPNVECNIKGLVGAEFKIVRVINAQDASVLSEPSASSASVEAADTAAAAESISSPLLDQDASALGLEGLKIAAEDQP